MKGVTHGMRISADAMRADRRLAIEQKRERQGDRDLDEHGADGPDPGAHEGGPECAVVEERDVVDEAAEDRRRLAQHVPVLERQPDSVDERNDRDGERHDDRRRDHGVWQEALQREPGGGWTPAARSARCWSGTMWPT